MLKFERNLPLLVFLLLFALSAKSQTVVKMALCDNRINPVGIDSRDMFFSWEIQSSKQAVTQSGYQLVIASTQEKLNAGNFDVLNTDLVKSSQSIQVHYKREKPAFRSNFFLESKNLG